jgi:hypothetical protein
LSFAARKGASPCLSLRLSFKGWLAFTSAHVAVVERQGCQGPFTSTIVVVEMAPAPVIRRFRELLKRDPGDNLIRKSRYINIYAGLLGPPPFNNNNID